MACTKLFPRAKDSYELHHSFRETITDCQLHIEEIKEIVVHKFSLMDVEDPDIFAAEPLFEWQYSEQGKWVMQHAIDTPTWHRYPDYTTFGHNYSITAKLKAEDITYFKLKWG